MKVCREYDVVGSAEYNGKKRYAIKPTGNWTIFTDDGIHLDSTDDGHLDGVLQSFETSNKELKGELWH